LSIAKWIADAHHASIRVESALGNGSTFQIQMARLPAVSSRVRQALTTRADSRSRETEPTP